MENKINIAELLKDCPIGMELDCPLFENLEFSHIDYSRRYSIICRVKTEWGGYNVHTFTEYGCFSIDKYAKCVIFPKGKTTWEGFHRPFKDGDIIYNKLQKRVCIYHYIEDKISCIDYCRYNEYYKTFEILTDYIYIAEQDYRLATEEEKAKLFQAIKDNSYKWNAESKTLEKIKTCLNCEVFKETHQNCPYSPIWNYKNLKEATSHLSDETNCEFWTKIPKTKTLEKLAEPKFKAGNIIKDIRNNSQGIILKITNDGYECYFETGKFLVNFKEQDYFELVPNKFNINTLKPFDKVLVRDNNTSKWLNTFYSKYNIKDNFPFQCIYFGKFKQCIPYEGNEHLFDTTNDCSEYYKTW